jgi:hypothetical protein
LSYLTSQFDALRQSDNFFFALRVDATFDYIHARAMRRTKEGIPLVQAAAVQPEFEFNDISGTLVGFWTPEYAKSLNVPESLSFPESPLSVIVFSMKSNVLADRHASQLLKNGAFDGRWETNLDHCTVGWK